MSGFSLQAKVSKVDDELGLVMGWAIICKENGEDYFDKQGDHIPEDSMMAAAVDFMENSRVASEMHTGDDHGNAWVFPMTTDVAKAFNIQTETTGLMIAMKPDTETLAKFKSGELAAFSIGGERITDEPVTDA